MELGFGSVMELGFGIGGVRARLQRTRSFSRKMKATMPAPQHSSKMNATSDPTSAPSTLSSSLLEILRREEVGAILET
eukprot:5839248-Pleurochrysis_carterae.AAC.1